MSDEHELFHIGVLRKSGRYPWGSGKTPNQRSRDFLSNYDSLRKQGLSDTEIAKGWGISTTQLRDSRSIANNELKKANHTQAMRLKDKGLSNVAAAEKMGIPESTFRSLIKDETKERLDMIDTTANMLKDNMKDGYLDIGEGTENWIGVSKEKLRTAVSKLENEGYNVYKFDSPQLGTNEKTKYKVLAPPKATFKEVVNNKDKIYLVNDRTDDNGRTFYGLQPPKNVSSKRIAIKYGEDGGADQDGIIELRPGVKDLSLGKSRYAQVRIAVDGTHYIKGVAIYSDDLPPGVDIRFNTNKPKGGSKVSYLKEMKPDPINPFGATIKLGGQKGALNIISEEGDWYKWSSKLSSQMLSKQKPELAKSQLKLSYDIKKAEYDEIMSLTNPTVRRKLLESFADNADSSAATLHAIGLPRTRQNLLIPITNMKETEIYAPQYKNGEKVVLIRHPHGGKFEIPELTVNNKQSTARKLLGNAIDAVGINPKVATQLSGADFDGDTVLVIPNKGQKVQTSAPLKALKDFDPRSAYPYHDGMKVMKNTQTEMGMISNLITDMTIKGANTSEIARAVKHSMVVIDAEKHKLNYKQSAVDNGIAELKKTYQGTAAGGATTLISRAKKSVYVPEMKPRPAKDGGPVDPATGKKKFVPTGNTYVDKNGQIVVSKTKLRNMDLVEDALQLSSGTPIERVYGEHATKLKALANKARKEAVNTKPKAYSPSAKVAYSKEVDSLNAKLNIAKKNAPLERKAQLLANIEFNAKKKATPGMDPDAIKKVKTQALRTARERTGAGKNLIKILPKEWEAIQSGAISNNKLQEILNNSDLDEVKKLATPRSKTLMTTPKIERAKAMQDRGYTSEEIANALGVSTTTLYESLSS